MKEFLRITCLVLGLIVAAAVTNGQQGFYYPGHGPFALYRIAETIDAPVIAPQFRLVQEVETPAIGVFVTCVPGPGVLNRRLPKGVITWTCAVANGGSSTSTVTEASLAHALLSRGVGVVTSTALAVSRGEDIRLGFWRRSTRYISQLALPAALAAAGNSVISITPTEGAWLAATAFVLPRLNDLWQERIPQNQIPVWSEPTDLAPGSHVVRVMYSSVYTGELPIQVMLPR